MKPLYAIGSVPRLSGHAIAYRWRSLPRVNRQRTSKPPGSSERVLPWQVTMDQLICASLSHTHTKWRSELTDVHFIKKYFLVNFYLNYFQYEKLLKNNAIFY